LGFFRFGSTPHIQKKKSVSQVFLLANRFL
jgi:hypothetical protein